MIGRIELRDGTQVDIRTDVTLTQIKKLIDMGVLSKSIVKNVLLADINPTNINDDDVMAMPYAAYYCANEAQPMSQEDFENKLEFDLVFCLDLYSRMIGSKESSKMAQAFEAKTKKPQGVSQ